MDGSWVRTTTTTLHKNNSTGACVSVTTPANCFHMTNNVSTTVAGNVKINTLTGRCVDTSTDKCQDGDNAVPTSATKGRKADGSNVCVTLTAGKCADSAGAMGDPGALQALDKNYSCQTVGATQCWDEAATPPASAAVGPLKSLHSVTKVCVAGTNGNCFESNA